MKNATPGLSSSKKDSSCISSHKKKKVSIYIITCTRIQALFQKIFLPILQIQVFQEALASPLDEALFVLLPSMHVQDSLRQLMDHLNDEHYQEYQSQGRPKNLCNADSATSFRVLRKKWENIACIGRKSQKVTLAKLQFYLILRAQRIY